MGAFSNMDYELQNSEAAVSDAFMEDDDMPQAAPAEPAAVNSPAIDPAPAAAASEPATASNTQSEDEARHAHEAAEAKRKAEWDAKQAEKHRAEQAALEKLDAMSPAELLKAAAKRVSADTEKLTRRNMKESVAEFIQTKCIDDLAFARLTMHPRKSMIHCFQYISRKAWDYVQDELKANGVQPGPGQQAYGCDIPDGLCYGNELTADIGTGPMKLVSFERRDDEDLNSLAAHTQGHQLKRKGFSGSAGSENGNIGILVDAGIKDIHDDERIVVFIDTEKNTVVIAHLIAGEGIAAGSSRCQNIPLRPLIELAL